MLQGQTLAARSAGCSAQLCCARTGAGTLAVAGASAGLPRLGSARLPGLRLPGSWHSFQEVPAGAYICAHAGRVQQFEFSADAGQVGRTTCLPHAAIAFWVPPVRQHLHVTRHLCMAPRERCLLACRLRSRSRCMCKPRSRGTARRSMRT
jgi:hypothetical protein